MKNHLLLSILILFAFAFYACDDDKENEGGQEVGLISEIRISDVQLSMPSIAEVVLVARVHIPAGVEGRTAASTNETDTRYMLRLPYNQKGMTIQLPQTPPESLLRNIEKDIPKGFNISDPEANTISFVEIGCCAAGSDDIMGQIHYCKSSDQESSKVVYIYCDRPVEITGTGKDWWGHQTEYNLKLKKGWNMTVEGTNWLSSVRTVTINNSLPKGMKWQYDMWL